MWTDTMKEVSQPQHPQEKGMITLEGKLLLLLEKNGKVWEETTPKLIDIQIFYFHFHLKLFCSEAGYFS